MKYVDYSYGVPPTYGTDQYTGEIIITNQGEHIDNRTVEFKIKNQPFTPYDDTNGNQIKLYYNFRFKGTYGEYWDNYPDTSRRYSYYTGIFPDTSASNTEYTVILIRLIELTGHREGTPEIPTGAKVEFQVQAIFGYVYNYDGFRSFEGEKSDWSSTQTVTIGDSQPTQNTPLPSAPTPSPSTQNPTSTAPSNSLQQPNTENDVLVGLGENRDYRSVCACRGVVGFSGCAFQEDVEKAQLNGCGIKMQPAA